MSRIAIVLFLLVSGAVSAQELTGTLKKVKESGTLTLGIRETSIPFSYLDEKQNAIGYSIDLCAKIVEAVKAELKMPNLTVRQIPVVSQTRVPLVANGTVDLECGSTTNTLTRQKQVEFSHVTFIGGTRLLVKVKSGVKEVEDLKGRPISVSQGTTNERVIKGLSDKLDLGIKVLNVKDHGEGFLVLESGRVDANVSDDIQLMGLRSRARNPKDYAVVGRHLSYEPFGLMFRRNDADFKLVVNRTLSGLMRSGEIEAIYAKWFDPLGAPLSDTMRTAFSIQALPE
ncbi:MAG: amino acid ABC transporter substrate-binding protein [Betaproteobacteria bacterium]|nr:amino acid ABC transporter substrate-binding protein [Betaproteobacteria bacterium]